MTSLEMAKISKRLEEGLKDAWRLRLDQKLPECRTIYYQLLKRLKVDPELFKVTYLQKVEATHLRIFVDAFLLQVSLLRAEGKIQEAVEGVEALEQILSKRGFPVPFQGLFQKGNNFLYRGDSSSALDQFVRATDIATTNEEKVISLSNMVLKTVERLKEPAT